MINFYNKNLCVCIITMIGHHKKLALIFLMSIFIYLKKISTQILHPATIMNDKAVIQSIKEEILNKSFFAFAFLGIPTLISSLFRIFYTGWTPLFIFQVIFVALLWGGYIFRKKISLDIKVFSLSIIGLVAGLWGAYTWGLVGGWLILLTLPPVVFSLFYGKKFGLISVLSAGIVLAFISVLHINRGELMFAGESDTPVALFWLNTIVTYLFLTSPLVILVGETSIFLESYIRKLGEKSNELKNSNQRVLEINKQLKRAKRRAEESDRLKTYFLENISHEIRTPLNGILGFSEILKQSDLSEAERNMYSDFVITNGRKFLSILDNVIYLAGLAAGNEEIVSNTINLPLMMQELEHTFYSYAVKKKISLYFDDDRGNNIVEIISDRGKIKKVLSELIGNAIKFTDAGEVAFGYFVNGQNEISFYVRDTGIGIPVRKKKVIFDRFMQGSPDISKKYGGAGMGLAITKSVVSILNGSVDLESKVGKGSVFTISFPLTIPEFKLAAKERSELS